MQQRGPPRGRPLAPQMGAARVRRAEQQPGRDARRRVADERVVGGDGRVDRVLLRDPVPAPRDRLVPRGRDGREQHDGRRELDGAEQRPVLAGDARRAGDHDEQRGEHEPPQAAADPREPVRPAAPRHVGARREQQVDAPARRRPGEHDLRRAAREQDAQRGRAVRGLQREAGGADPGRTSPATGTLERDEPGDRDQRRRGADPEGVLRPHPVRLDPRLVSLGAQRVVARHREPPLGVAAHGAGRHRGER